MAWGGGGARLKLRINRDALFTGLVLFSVDFTQPVSRA